ncbi:hypothetical protein JOE51_006121 [Bradyrhizobium japonicum]|uniref:Uncharacterized protein n=1 Tax=Bradyrhizobium barranii subsp. barranii TaxID=2823807 RepID=A0A939MGD5_9BRAD|nr:MULTISPECIES: hypothetical protein [Bradyrhizobium]MBP1064654.1 hypothetical protein [Bradyrhizobium japonicum]UEM09225.1 hypothetical protein J4G43_031345 [Bradyrhizobium barranii subsp. barranii]WLB15969.1 hypothetical protein QIH95_28450 [Bradyrhizobium japonicum]
MRLGLGLGIVRSTGTVLAPPPGYVFVVDSDGFILVDSDGAFLIDKA